ncbi:MAG: hypothetical protein ACFCVD_13985 [Nodosilinea sp.]
MLCFTRPDPWVLQEPRDLNPLHLANPNPPPGRERLRHLVIGSTEGVQSTINRLHVLTYAEQELIQEAQHLSWQEQFHLAARLLQWAEAKMPPQKN